MTRKDAKIFIHQLWRETIRGSYGEEALEIAIKALEESERKTGEWISHYDEDAKEGWYECSYCHSERAFNTKYCPDCGARMSE